MSLTEGIFGEVSDEFVPETEEGPAQPAPIYRNALVGLTPTQAEAAGIDADRLADRETGS